MRLRLILVLFVITAGLLLAGCDDDDQKAGGLRKSDFEVVGWDGSDGGFLSGICWDGQYRWVCTRNEDAKIWQLPASGNDYIKSFNAPGMAPSGIYKRNDRLWITDEDSTWIFEVSPDNGQILEMHPFPHTGNSGITWVNDKLYITNWVEGKIFRLSSDLDVEKIYTGPYNYNCFYGIGYDGTQLWVGDFIDGRAYTFDLDLNLTNTYVSPDYHPTGWAWNGTYLLNSDSTTNRIYFTIPPD